MKKTVSNKEALKIIVEAAKNYDLRLKDKHFLIIYQAGKQVKAVSVGFRDMNFLDLTGVQTHELLYHHCMIGDFINSGSVYKVCAILSKNYNETRYNRCTYLAKGQELEKLALSEDVVEYSCI